jgi:hypothetical protein
VELAAGWRRRWTSVQTFDCGFSLEFLDKIGRNYLANRRGAIALVSALAEPRQQQQYGKQNKNAL